MGGCYTQLYSPFEKAAQLYTHKNESENLTNQQHETLKKSEEGPGRAAVPPRPLLAYQMYRYQPTHQRPVYQHRVIRCGSIIAFAL